MQLIKTCLFIGAFFCLPQQAAFAAEKNDLSTPQAVAVATTDTSPAKKEFDPDISQAGYNASEIDEAAPTTTDKLSEIIIRPVSVVASVTGLAIFIVGSPISGLASIPEPHDAFKTTWNDFVVTPYHFTFRRPLGDYSVELYD